MTVDENLGGRLATAPPLLLAASCFDDDPTMSRPGAAHVHDGRVALSPGPGLGVVPYSEWLGQPLLVMSGQSATR
jgi:hypothetical protein